MPRSQTMLFAMKLLKVAEDAKGQVTIEEMLEAFINISDALSKKIEAEQVNRALAEKIAARTKSNPNLVN